MFGRGKRRKEYLCTKDILMNEDGVTQQVKEYEYDQDGMLLMQTVTAFSPQGDGEKVVPIVKIMRDAYGVLLSKTEFECGKAVTKRRTLLYRTESDGLVHQIIEPKETGGKMVYFIDYHGVFPRRRGLISSMQSLGEGDKLLNEFRYVYDDYAHQVKEYMRNRVHGEFTLTYHREFEYDERDRSVRITYFKNGEPAEHFILDRAYDERGLCLDAAFLRDPKTLADDEPIVTFFHKYEYTPFQR